MKSNSNATRCAIYTRQSISKGLDAHMNSLATQREVCSAYIASQKYKSWTELSQRYDDSGQSGGDLDRPALAALMRDIEDGKIDNVVVYKVDRLTRSLIDFVRLIDLFEQKRINLVSISQAFDTSDSMGRMVLNILLTFSQFEREMIAERVRDSLQARKRHGKIHGGKPPFGYQIVDDELQIDEHEAEIVRFVFAEFLRTERYIAVQRAVTKRGYVSSMKPLRKGGLRGGTPIPPRTVYSILHNPIYVGEIKGHERNYPGRHEPLVSRDTWETAIKLTKARRKPKPHAKGTEHFLTGLLKDELGRPMFVEITRSKGKVFTYYTSVATSWARTHYIKAYRTHAGRFDDLMIAALSELLCDRTRVRAALKKLGVRDEELEKLASLGLDAAKRLSEMPRPKVAEAIRALVCEIELGREQVSISIRASELKRFIEWDDVSTFGARPADRPLSDARFDFLIEVQATSTEKWMRLNISPRCDELDSAIDKPLVDLIKSARDAQRLVDAHRELSIPDLAEKRGMRPSQFARLIRVNYLAPDIVTSILDGTQPQELTRKGLLSSNIPTDWALQRRLLGFPVPEREPIVQRDTGLWSPKSGAQ